jgi:prevent-host-death family protein
MKYTTLSKSEFKPKALFYLRQVQQNKKPLIITHNATPVAKIIPYDDTDTSILDELRGTVQSYSDPFEPVGLESWGVLNDS